MKQHNKGFTLAGVLIAVAILAILGMAVTTAVGQFRRSLARTKMDSVAREIFVAAQNHLTMAAGQGYFGLNGSDFGIEEKVDDKSTGVYYTVSGQNEKLWALLLPPGSISESVRLEGSCIIRYNKDTAQVLDVFYAETIGEYPHTFAAGNFESLMSSFRSSAGRDARQNSDVAVENWRGAVIGWYGAEAAVDAVAGIPNGELLSTPAVKVENGDLLAVRITNPNTNEVYYGDVGLRLVIKGCSSGQYHVIDLIDKDGHINSDYAVTALDKSQFYVILDDVTSNDPLRHFYNRCCGDVLNPDRNLIPGEDITVWAVSYNSHAFTNIATGSGVTTNSLFASLGAAEKGGSGATTTISARVTSFRHLENLDPRISGFPYEFTAPKGYIYQEPATESEKKACLTEARQTAGLDWQTFCANTSGGDIYRLASDRNVQKASDESGCYAPVCMKAGYPLDYAGKGDAGAAAKVCNVKIDTAGAAGLFGELIAGSSVKNLELEDFTVTSTAGPAGMLAGSAVDTQVSGVLVRREAKDASEVSVQGKTYAGGLIGHVQQSESDAVTVKQCAAAVCVQSTDGDAGGLIGKSEGAVTVEKCYAAGHTEDGHYTAVANVTAAQNAGGLVGSGSTLTVTNCYATASVQGGSRAGGLAGSLSGGSVSGCYCTGEVHAGAGTGALAGAFLGERSGTPLTGLSNCYYYALSNDRRRDTAEGETPEDDPPAVGNTETSDVKAFDDKLDTYLAYTTSGTGTAEPYDSALKKLFDGRYGFRCIADLTTVEDGAPPWMKTHYGDWPAYETKVVND